MMVTLEYFKNNYPGVKNLGDITWSHAVNSQEKATRYIGNPKIMVIEADIRISKDGQIITTHPPALESDQTFEQFMEKLGGSKQGIKLDFKDPEVLIPLFSILEGF